MCFGRRFYKRHRPPRLFFERALWREKRAHCCENVRFVMQTTTFLQSAPPCIWNMPFAANGVQSATLDPLGERPKSSKTDIASFVCLAVLLAVPLVVRFGRSAAQILQNGPPQLFH